MKKIITIVLACLMASSFICVGVSAAAENTTKNIAKVQITSEELSKMTTEEIAYLNLENADEEAKEVILAARNKIIYTREWAADGYSGYVTDKDGNIKRVLPNFSEVFPGWDLPKLERKSNPTVQPKFINCDIDDVNAAIEAARNAENKITEQMTTEEIANLDLASADEETKDAILAARNKIIFSQEWVADGYSMEVVDSEGNVKRTIPKFSELFPGWDLPKATRNKAPTTLPTIVESSIEDVLPELNTDTNQSRGLNDWLPFAGGNVYLHEATTVNAENFHEFYTDVYTIGTSVGTYVTQLTSSETCNIGYSNLLTDESIGFLENLSIDDGAVIHNVGDMYLGVRASTYSNPGWAYFDIFGSNRYGYIK